MTVGAGVIDTSAVPRPDSDGMSLMSETSFRTVVESGAVDETLIPI